MEAKLREYRALRQRRLLVENTEKNIQESKDKLLNHLVPNIGKDMEKNKDEEEILLMENEEPLIEPPKPKPRKITEIEEPSEVVSEVNELESIAEETQESWRYFITKWSLYSLIWITLYFYFLKIQFGAVFFVISVLIGICLNTRTKPKKRGEVSAYSVFNENCVSIDGTLTPEQFEREIRYGVGTV